MSKDPWKPPDDLDPECLALCAAINGLRGIVTTSSCCGHGRDPYRIWIHCKKMKYLPDLLYWLDACHSGFTGWIASIYTDCGKSFPRIMIEGPSGSIAYSQSERIAELIVKNELKN